MTQAIQQTQRTLRLAVPETHPCYAGHFPNHPLVPGALLLAWVRALLNKEAKLDCHTLIYGKFTQAIKPGAILSLTLQPNVTEGKIRSLLVTVSDADKVCAKLKYDCAK